MPANKNYSSHRIKDFNQCSMESVVVSLVGKQVVFCSFECKYAATRQQASQCVWTVTKRRMSFDHPVKITLMNQSRMHAPQEASNRGFIKIRT